jgi:hypothetical protein
MNIKKIAVVALVLCVTACTKEAPNKPEMPITPQTESSKSIRLAGVESEVERLLEQLTLDEKIGLVHASGYHGLFVQGSAFYQALSPNL